ncbi:MAG: alanine dehydrogenase [Cryomorphaceae bacterium]|nr:alanine dehydrogenase [Cryomorphaceae bacterium]
MKLGVIREGKVPPDKRVVLTPEQCALLVANHPEIDLVVQKSPIRIFKDAEYENLGIQMADNLSDRDIIIGVKEVPVDMLIPNKTYLFFSHTLKMQAHNAKLLRAVLDKKIRLIDWETIRQNGKRLIGFGRYAGIVGCYNGFRAYGIKSRRFDLKPANLCHDRSELENELKKVTLPADFKIVVTGFGRVGHGAREILALLPIKEITKDSFLNDNHHEAVFTNLDTQDYFVRKSDGGFEKSEFYRDGHSYKSILSRFTDVADMYIACHFWSEHSPIILEKEDLKADGRLKVVADISCDVEGPIASTIKASTIAEPFFGYHPASGREVDFRDEHAIAVMSVDNLPCELPRDASEDFGNEFMTHVLPRLLNGDADGVLANATETTFEGTLTEKFSYLAAYAGITAE